MKLHDIQKTVNVGKDKKNDFGGYNYRTAEGILAALKAAMPDGATVIVSDSLQEVAGQIFITSTATLTFEGGSAHSATGHALHPLSKKGMDPSQITGAASSYARKYALAGLMALDDGSIDPDANAAAFDIDLGTERDRIKHAIQGARSLSGLQKTWTDNGEMIARIKDEKPPMYAELSKSKDDKKTELSPPDPAMQSPVPDESNDGGKAQYQ